MKSKIAVYGFLAIALAFAGLMGYLRFTQSDGHGTGAAGPAGENPGRPGKVVIAYAGDLKGSLDPCG
jgi:hypothetical protein